MLKLLTNKWLVRVLGLIAIGIVIYVLGPMFAFGDRRPLESVEARYIFILLIVVVWLLRHLFKAQRAGKVEKQMVSDMVAVPVAPAGPDVSTEELNTIKDRFEEAMGVLKKSRGRKGRFSLYDLPWYIIIGPPGSGKTTALLNSGLRFPLADRFGPDAIRGVGGTRNCDWWFTDDAILIDTAGRYTTQDSDSQADQAGWLGFLDLLKKHRKRRPINGIFVAISVSDLLTQSEQERNAHIRAIKERVMELDKHFGIRFPVYVLFTKCDLIAGFTDFFEDLGRGEREQVWGVTFPYSDDSADQYVKSFGSEFDLLIRRVNERLLSRIGQERNVQRRSLIHGFPKQMSALKENFSSFITEVFQSSRYETSPMLRGVYFTSGTQEGTPIDRLMSTLARTFQIDAQALAPQTGAGKSFFITDVLKKVAFAEAGIAGTNRRFELQRALLQKGAYVGVAGVVALAALAWSFAYLRNSAYIDEMADGVRQTRELIASVNPRDPDPLAVLPPLNAARALPGGYTDRVEGLSWFGGFGLSQEDKLGETAVASYQRLLSQLFLSRVMLRLENQLRGGGPSPDYTYEALKAYLMLDSRDHYDPAAIKAFVQLDWDVNLPRQVGTEQRQALGAHLTALFDERPAPLPLPINDAAVVQARREVRAMPLEERIYGRLRRTFQEDIPGFNIRDAAGGPSAELVFVRKSGVPLATPLPALFTKQAYQRVFVERSRALTSELAGESWILGEEETIGPLEQEQLLAQVRARYLDEFARLYTEAILDVGLASFGTPEEAARIFSILSRADSSPLLLLLQEIARQTSLDRNDANASLTERVEGGVAQIQERLRQVIGSTGRVPQSLTDALVRNQVEERFSALNALVEQREGQPRPVDHLLDLIRELYQYMSVVASEAAGGSIPPNVQQQGQAVLQQFRMESSTQPNLLVGELLQTAASRSNALTTGGLRAYLNELWRSGPLAVCSQAIAGRYPIVQGGAQTIRLDDFGAFFGYGGHVDRFFSEHLRKYVDVTASPWRPRQTGNVPIQLSAAALRAFEYADTIKQTFFRPGSMSPSVAFDLRPLEMDTNLSRFLLDLEGQIVTYEFGPMISTLMQWPGPNPGTEVRLEFTDRQAATPAMQRFQGPWAWFQLLDGSNLRSTSVPEQFEVTFTRADRTVVYELIARSAFNPFSLTQLQQFQCPGSL
jgi:type VI secretion system protein ImpL